MSHREMTATKLRLILSCMLFVITLVGVAIFYFANGMLTQVATDVSHTVADASASQNNLQVLQKTEKDLEANEQLVQRAGEVVANSESYEYQNQIINDLNQYAARAGIELTNIDFATDSKTATTTQPAAGATAPAATPAPAGVNKATITVTAKNPIDYLNLLRFIQSIEQNLTKMQLSSIGITKDQTGVSSDVLTITTYVR